MVTPSGPLGSRRLLIALSALVVILMIGGALSFIRYAQRNAPNPRLVAVAPFDVFAAESAPALAGWRVELAESLTTALAVAPLETVPQARVRERWKSAPSGEIAAVELARRTSAGTAVYGRIDTVAGRADSLLARVIVADAATSGVLFGVVLRWPAADPAGLARAIAGRIRANHPVTRSEAGRDSP